MTGFVYIPREELKGILQKFSHLYFSNEMQARVLHFLRFSCSVSTLLVRFAATWIQMLDDMKATLLLESVRFDTGASSLS